MTLPLVHDDLLREEISSSAALADSTKQQTARALNANSSHNVGDDRAEQVREQREQKEQKQHNADRGAAITDGFGESATIHFR
jgi:hypothetical protein